MEPETQLNEKFRARLIHYQEDHDMTRKKLASRIGVGEACLSKWVNRLKNWNRAKIMQVAYDLDIEIEDLLMKYDRMTRAFGEKTP